LTYKEWHQRARKKLRPKTTATATSVRTTGQLFSDLGFHFQVRPALIIGMENSLSWRIGHTVLARDEKKRKE